MTKLPRFKKIAIIGLGLIGGSVGLALKRKGVGSEIIGVDQEAIVARAQEIGAIDRGFDKGLLAKGVGQADLVIVAVPIGEILSLIPHIAAMVKPGALVTDVGSTKRKIMGLAQRVFPPGKYFLGGHPMAGSERSGIEAADPFLFENTIYVLSPSGKLPEKIIDDYAQLLERIGAKVVLMDALTHDQIAAGVSHLPQLLAVALVNLIGRLNDQNPFYLKMAAGGFRDMTRIASSPFELWEDICETNQQEIIRFINLFIEELSSLRKLIGSAELEAKFTQAALNRLSIPRDSKGFLSPHFDLSLVVEDRPGVIASISTILANENINIKDIEVLKVREGEGGTLRLSLETEEDRARALGLLQQKGFTCRKRT